MSASPVRAGVDKYDPDNLFRMNQNITPSKRAGEPAL
ncbi:MAG TPA: BBE domain-containing protein [Gaiellaceae bacterium]|nr:BBE domain-containing protein [Gaiellaceae bacterium]